MIVEIDARDAKAALDRVPAALQKRLFPVLNRWGLGVVGHIKANKLDGQVLNHRTRTLSRAVFHRVEESGEEGTLEVGVDLAKAPYGRVHEYGGTIRPKTAAHLTIPIGRALTASGVARFRARQVIASPASFGFASTFARNGIIFGTNKGAAPSPLFVLKDSVTLKARPYLSTGWNDKYEWGLSLLDEAIDEIVKET